MWWLQRIESPHLPYHLGKKDDIVCKSIAHWLLKGHFWGHGNIGQVSQEMDVKWDETVYEKDFLSVPCSM